MLFKQLNKLLYFVFLVSLPSTVIAVDGLVAKDSTKLAVVNISVLMKQSPRAKSLGEEMKRKYFPQEEALTEEADRLKELEARLDKDASNNSDPIKINRAYRARKRQYTRDYETFRDQLSTARQDALVAVRQEVMAAIAAVREQQKIDIVIDNYVAASDSVDITQAVIQYLELSYKKEQGSESTQIQIELKEMR